MIDNKYYLESILKNQERILKNQEEEINRLKRTETKLSHGFDALGVNITDDSNIKDNVINKLFIEKIDNENKYIIRITHEDVTISSLKKFLSNKSGSFVIISGDTTWTITI